MLSSKIENAHWAQKTTATHCGIWETETTRNFMLWLFLNNHNALWHVKICHEAKVVSWLLEEMTTSSESSGLTSVQCVTSFFNAICGSYSQDSEGFELKVTCNLRVKEESNQHWARRCKIWSGTSSKMVSLSNSRLPAVDIGTNVVVRVPDLHRGRLAPQKRPSSRRWCQLFWALSVGHEGRPTWAAVCSQWIHNCWQQLHQGTWRALKFTISSVSLNDNFWK